MKLTSVCSYRYALCPSPAQARVLARASDQARRLWNELVTLRGWAEDEQRHGRREALLHEYGRLLARKALVGVAYTQARRLMRERGLPDEATALALARAEQVQAARRYGHRRLALTYAIERARRNAKAKGLTISAKAIEAVARRFASAGAIAIAGKRGQPCPKHPGSTVTIQGQADPRCVSPVDFALGTVDLATLMGSECCRAVPAVLHRPLPPGARIKQVAVTATSTGFFLILMVEAPAAAFLRPVPTLPMQTVAGIDPGRGTALTASDTDGQVQFSLKPPLFQNARFLKKTRRLQRRAARQIRAANPACFDERGRRKKSSHASAITHSLCKVRRTIARRRRHLADARHEVYHLGVNRLLREFAVVGMGDWRGMNSASRPGPSHRAQNRKDHDNAVGSFAKMLKDKAARCSPARLVVDVPEAYTTRACPDCGALSGPHGEKDLKVRVWTCTSCAQTHQRDFASARAIARRARAQTAAGAQPAQPEPFVEGARTPAAPSTQVSGRSVRTESPSARNPVSEPECRSGVSADLAPRGPEADGVEAAFQPNPCSQPPAWQQPDLPLVFEDTLHAHAKDASTQAASTPRVRKPCDSSHSTQKTPRRRRSTSPGDGSMILPQAPPRPLRQASSPPGASSVGPRRPRNAQTNRRQSACRHAAGPSARPQTAV